MKKIIIALMVLMFSLGVVGSVIACDIATSNACFTCPEGKYVASTYDGYSSSSDYKDSDDDHYYDDHYSEYDSEHDSEHD